MNTPQKQQTSKKYGMIKKSSKGQRQFFDSAEWSLENKQSKNSSTSSSTEIYKPYSIVILNEARKKAHTPTSLKDSSDNDQV